MKKITTTTKNNLTAVKNQQSPKWSIRSQILNWFYSYSLGNLTLKITWVILQRYQQVKSEGLYTNKYSLSQGYVIYLRGISLRQKNEITS